MGPCPYVFHMGQQEATNTTRVAVSFVKAYYKHVQYISLHDRRTSERRILMKHFRPGGVCVWQRSRRTVCAGRESACSSSVFTGRCTSSCLRRQSSGSYTFCMHTYVYILRAKRARSHASHASQAERQTLRQRQLGRLHHNSHVCIDELQ